MSNNFDNNFEDEDEDEEEDEEEDGPEGETFEEMLRRLAASGNLTTRHVSDDDEEGESREISVAEFLAQMSGVSQFDNDEYEEEDDDDDDDDEEDEEESSGSQNLFFGIGQNGEVTNMTNEGGGFSLSFTLDQDGEEIPEARCPKCNKKGTHVWDPDNGIYKCDFCDNEFVPEIYKALDSAEEYVNRAWRNFKQRNYKRTIRDCTSAIKLDPNFTLAYTIRGKALGAREEYQEAEKDFSEAIRISPDDDNAHFSRGETRLYLENMMRLSRT